MNINHIESHVIKMLSLCAASFLRTETAHLILIESLMCFQRKTTLLIARRNITHCFEVRICEIITQDQVTHGQQIYLQTINDNVQLFLFVT